MHYLDWNSYDFGWSWILWFASFILMFSSVGNWGYAYSAHCKIDGSPRR